MEPWQFNIYQSVVSSAPAITLSAIIGVGFTAPTDSDLFASAVALLPPAGRGIALKIWSYLTPLWPPFSLAVASFCSAKGSLDPKDATMGSIARARRAFLYFDGAFGFIPQTILSLATLIPLLLVWLSTTERPTVVVGLTGVGILLAIGSWVAFARQYILSTRRIPAMLFMMNGYPTDLPDIRIWRPDPQRRRWWRYSLWGGLYLSVALLVLLLLLAGTALLGGFLSAAAKTWIAHN
jgi:hypothetical protein